MRVEPYVTLIAILTSRTLAELRGDSRNRKLMSARHLAAWLAIKRGCSQSATGRFLNRDHATARHSFCRIEEAPHMAPLRKRLLALLEQYSPEEALEIARMQREARERRSPIVEVENPPAEDVPFYDGTRTQERSEKQERDKLKRMNERFLAALRREAQP